MTPQEYVEEIVLPTLREFKVSRRSRRLAYLSCMAVFHIKDHLKKAGQTHIEDQMRKATGHWFDVVRAICNGAKHFQTDTTHPMHFEPVRIMTGRRRFREQWSWASRF
jgi:hypothetical protein